MFASFRIRRETWRIVRTTLALLRAPGALGMCALLGGCELVLGGIPAELGSSDASFVDEEDISTPDDRESTADGGSVDGDHEEEAPDNDVPSPAGDPDAEQDDAEEDDGEDCDDMSIWYVDQDADGFGAGTPVPSCGKPSAGYTRSPGDCSDDDPRVHPGQTSFFGTPYVSAGGGPSFDYDCSGSEDGSTAQSLEPNCEKLIVPMCGRSGFMKTNRPGALNAYCGSTTVETCKASVAVVLCASEKRTSDVPYACR